MTEKFYSWHEEPNFISIQIEENYQKDLIKRAIKKVKTIENLSKFTGLSKATIHNYKNYIGMNIKGLKSILDILEIKYNRINHKIIKIGWNNNHLKIKINSNEMAILLAASLADGHLDKSHFMYKNKNPELRNRVRDCVRQLFGNQIKIHNKTAKNGVDFITCPSIVKRQLNNLGSPSGKKLFQNPSVPKLIKNGTKIQKKLFIQQFFDDEGWPETQQRRVACAQCADTTKSLPKNFIKNLEFRTPLTIGKIPKDLKHKIIQPNLLLEIKKILEDDFKIIFNLKLKKLVKFLSNYKREYVSATWELECIRKEDIKNFYEKIGFFSSNKQTILKEMVKEKPLLGDLTEYFINKAIYFHKKKGYFQIKDIRGDLNLESFKIRKRLATLVNKRILFNHKGEYSLRIKI